MDRAKASVDVSDDQARPCDRREAEISVTELDWQSVRQPTDASADELRDETVRWLARLPRSVRPMETGRQYPRIVNRIFELWPHCEYTRLFFQSLLVDRRKGRKGFPSQVRKELEALDHYYFAYVSGLPEVLWKAVPVRPPRIPQHAFPHHREKSEIDIPPL
jgi:hypothetical protein